MAHPSLEARRSPRSMARRMVLWWTPAWAAACWTVIHGGAVTVVVMVMVVGVVISEPLRPRLLAFAYKGLRDRRAIEALYKKRPTPSSTPADIRSREISVSIPKPGKLHPTNPITVPKLSLNRWRMPTNPDGRVDAGPAGPSKTSIASKPGTGTQVDGRRRRLADAIKDRQVEGAVNKTSSPNSLASLDADQGRHRSSPHHRGFIPSEGAGA